MKKLNLVAYLICNFFLIQAYSQSFVLHNINDGPTTLQTLTVDEDDRVWVAVTTAFSGNIDYFENGEWSILDLESENLISARATDIIAKDGIVEVSSYGSWSQIDWDNQNYKTWDANGSAVNCIAKDYASDILYVGDSGNMKIYDGDNKVEIAEIKKPTSALFDENTGTLWAASDFFGLYKYKDNTVTGYNRSNTVGMPDDDILDLDIDDDGVLWMVIKSQGLVSFDGQDWTVYNSENSNMVNNSPDNVVVDNNNNIWIGGVEYGGLSYFDGNEFKHYLKSENAIPVSNIRDMDVDSNNDLWMATSSGLMQFKNVSSSIESTHELSSVKVYPSTTSSTLQLDNYQDVTSYSIYNLNGEKLKSASLIANPVIEVSGLMNGAYVILLTTSDDRTFSQMFFKI